MILLSIHNSTQLLDGYDRDDRFRFDALPSQILMSAFLPWAKSRRSRVFGMPSYQYFEPGIKKDYKLSISRQVGGPAQPRPGLAVQVSKMLPILVKRIVGYSISVTE